MDESLKTERPSGPLDGKFKYKTKQDGTVDRQKVLCTLCWKEFSFHRSTSSLKYHLNAKHQHVVDFANTSDTAAPRLRQSTLTRRREHSKSTADELTDTNAKRNTAVKPFNSSTDIVTLGLCSVRMQACSRYYGTAITVMAYNRGGGKQKHRSASLGAFFRSLDLYLFMD